MTFVHQPGLELARGSLRGPNAPPVQRIHSLFLGGALLEVQAPVNPGTGMVLDLFHPAMGTVATNVVTAWCRPLQGVTFPVLAVEFHNSWDGLVGFRHQLAAWLGSRVYDGPRFVGYVMQEPNDPANSCFDVQTGKIALVVPHERGFLVKRRDAPPSEPPGLAGTFFEALQFAFALSRPPNLNVPGPAEPPAAAPPGALGAAQPASSEEEELLGMNTVVLGPETGPKDDEVFDAQTMVLKPADDSQVLGAGRVFGPSAERYPHSKALVDGEHRAFVARSPAESSFNLFSLEGRKLALLSRQGDQIQIMVMGEGKEDSLEFLVAENFIQGLELALEAEGQAVAVDPPLAGFE